MISFFGGDTSDTVAEFALEGGSETVPEAGASLVLDALGESGDLINSSSDSNDGSEANGGSFGEAGRVAAVLHNPEPASLMLFGGGLLGLGFLRRRNRSQS